MVLTIATAGLVYELSMAAAASYLLGDSVAQFSLVIGVYLSALGVGAYASRAVEHRLTLTFVDVELATALLGGLSTPALFLAFSYGASFTLVLLVIVLLVGTLVGIELPLLMRILQAQWPFKELVARALTFDYAGALLGSLGFSLFFLPRLGLVRTSIVCGLLNALVALASIALLKGESDREGLSLRRARLRAILVFAILGVALVFVPRWVEYCETARVGRVLAAVDSPYQRIVLGQRGSDVRLYLNGHLQFSSVDEARYHEALVHPVMAAVADPRRILVGGGGDGLAVREILKWPTVEAIRLVDLDPAMTELGRVQPELRKLNRGSLSDPKVQITNQDAFSWLEEEDERYDVLLFDFPDPSTYSLGKLYSTRFYANARRLLAPGGALGVQATSPWLSRQSYWTIINTLESVGLNVRPYRIHVPSFGDWGFALASVSPIDVSRPWPALPLRSLSPDNVAHLFVLPWDTQRVAAPIQRLDNQTLVGIYVAESSRWD